MLTRYFTAPLLVLALTTPALSQTHVIAQLGTSPLLGQIESTQALQSDVARNERLFEQAGSKLGLSSSEYSQLRDRIATARLTYVTIPRRLDAMTWSANGQVRVLHDVVIPANTRGWEADLKENGQIVAVFIPNKCGNLSLVRRPAPVVASLPTRVKASHYAPPVAAPAAVPAPPTAPSTAAPVAETQPAPAATPAPYTTLASTTPPQAAGGGHHFPWFLLLLPVIGLVGGHGGSISTAGPPTISSGGGPGGGPTPPPVSCPTPTPHK